jgi:phage gpG-like protein
MNIEVELEVDQSEVSLLASSLEAAVEEARPAVQSAMAEAYYDVVYGNIGEAGVDRPIFWPPLSKRYADKMSRSHATLFVNGQLLNAIKLDNSSDEQSTVSVSDQDCPYAVAHQYGYPPRNLPARPYFPFDPQTGETTAFTMALVQAAAEFALSVTMRENFRGRFA